MRKGDKVLQVSSGFFSTRFEHTYVQYGMELHSVGAAKPGLHPENALVEKRLKDAKASGKPFRVLSISEVDTSTAVLADLKALCDITRAVSPLIVVDAVCSAGGEELRMDEWGIDFVMTGSQKAFGVPPGLCILIASERVMAQMPGVHEIPNYFVNLQLAANNEELRGKAVFVLRHARCATDWRPPLGPRANACHPRRHGGLFQGTLLHENAHSHRVGQDGVDASHRQHTHCLQPPLHSPLPEGQGSGGRDTSDEEARVDHRRGVASGVRKRILPLRSGTR